MGARQGWQVGMPATAAQDLDWVVSSLPGINEEAVGLRLRSYHVPSLLEHLFATLAACLGSRLATEVDLPCDTTHSGPRPSPPEHFSSGQVDLAFVSATSYVGLTAGGQLAVEFVGAAWAPTVVASCSPVSVTSSGSTSSGRARAETRILA